MKNKTIDDKSMENKGSRDAIRAARIKRTAEICGVSERLVNYVLELERNNDKVELVYFSLVDADTETDNKLKEAVRNLVPFN